MRTRLVFLALLLLTGYASAEIEKKAHVGKKGIDLYWWPKFAALKGWSQDEPASEGNGINALAPIGSNFSNAVAVIYGRACYKPRWSKKTLRAFIESDKRDFQKDSPGQKCTEASPIQNGNGVKMRSLEFFPIKKGNWERVAYLAEGEFWVVFTLSSRTKASYQASLPAFLNLLNHYKK